MRPETAQACSVICLSCRNPPGLWPHLMGFQTETLEPPCTFSALTHTQTWSMSTRVWAHPAQSYIRHSQDAYCSPSRNTLLTCVHPNSLGSGCWGLGCFAGGARAAGSCILAGPSLPLPLHQPGAAQPWQLLPQAQTQAPGP